MECKVGVIGLGYVGLPLTVESGKLNSSIGSDIDEKIIGELRNCAYRILEIHSNEFRLLKITS